MLRELQPVVRVRVVRLKTRLPKSINSNVLNVYTLLPPTNGVSHINVGCKEWGKPCRLIFGKSRKIDLANSFEVNVRKSFGIR